jgi:DNA repair protein RecN (Recombination protein N)
MLTHLTIVNYALIDQLDIDFYQGFTAITGETGAGKSIMVDALDLALGKRADNHYLLDPSRKCVVEAVFMVNNYNLKSFFELNGLDYDSQAIIRRELSPAGKSRAFINDTPVTLTQLKSLGDLLVDIHAQHATSSLHDPGFQLSVIDSFAGLFNEVESFHEKFIQLKMTRELLTNLVMQEENAKTSLDYKQFLLDEIVAANLEADEQEKLEESLTLITHAEEIKGTLYQVQAMLNEDESGCLNLLSQAEISLQKIAGYHPGIDQQFQRIKSDLIDLKDILMELTGINDSIEFSQQQMEDIRQRLDLIYRLQHKHHVSAIAGLIEIGERLKQEMTEFSSLEKQIESVRQEITEADLVLKSAAEKLSLKRKAVFPKLTQEIVTLLQHMGIPEARFEIRQQDLMVYNIHGIDNIEFYFNANKGHSLKPLSDVASGGELSRVMLSIKSIISDKKLLPTILFDEIDNGLSGDIAGRVGEVLSSAATRMQVIAVTHLPQIAGKARHHYSVFKQNKNNITFSNIKFLDQKERVTELAKMIGGRDITAASLAAAEELLTSNQ